MLKKPSALLILLRIFVPGDKDYMKLFRKLLFIIILTLLIASCSSQAANQEEEASNKLVIYSGRSETLVGPIIEEFSQSTGIEVEVRYGSTAEMAATILEEGQNSPADVFFAQDPGGLGALADAGQLAVLPDSILSLVEARFISPDKLWIGISGRARVVVYNTDLLKAEDLPDSLWGFTEPEWKGRIGLPPTNGSFQTMITGMRHLWGEDDARLWLEGIMENEPVFYEKNTPTVAAVEAGEVEIGFVNHYYLHRFLAEEGESFAARNYYLANNDIGSLVMVSGAGKLSSSKNQANALLFLEFLLSVEAQQYFSEETFEYPLVQGIAAFGDLPPLSSLNDPNIDLGDLADLEGSIALLQEVGMLP